MSEKVSRRRFLRVVAVGAGGLLAASCQPKVVEVEKVVKETVIEEVERVVKETVIVAGTPKVVEKVVKETVVIEVPAKPKVEEPITIAFALPWGEGSYLGDLQKALLERHGNRVPDTNITVDLQLGVKAEAINLALAAGNPPEVFRDRYLQARIDSIEEGLYVCVQDVLEAEGITMDIFEEAALAAYTVKDKMWAFPYEMVIQAWIYEPDVFEDAGVEPPTKDWTWTDAIDIGVKMTVDKAGKHPGESGFDVNDVDVWGLCPWFYFGGEEHYPRIAGGEYINEEKTEFNCTTQPFVETVNWFREIFHEKQIGVLTRPERGMQTGKIALYETGNWSFLGMEKDCGEIAALFPPRYPGSNKMSTILADKELWVTKQEDQKQSEAGYKFAKWWDFDVYLDFALLTGYLPYLKRDTKDPRWVNLLEDKPFMRVATDLVAHGRARFWSLFDGAFEAWDVMTEMWSAIEATDTPAEELLADAETKVQRILDKYRK